MFGISDNNQSDKTAGTSANTSMPEPMNQSMPPTPMMQPEPQSPSSAPALPMNEPSTDISSAPGSMDKTAPSGDLMGLKQKALQDLQPLVNHLDQSPEEKFKTTMMLIQSTDNSALINQAYEAANQIPDEKKKAQALLDVVNEINYFTQNSKDSAEKLAS